MLRYSLLVLRSDVGVAPYLSEKARVKWEVEVNPQALAICEIELSDDKSNVWAAFIRVSDRIRSGVSPTFCLKSRVKWNLLTQASDANWSSVISSA